MRIKYLASMAGVGYARSPGDVADVDDAEAGRLIAAGFAAQVEEQPAAADKPARAKGRKAEAATDQA